MVFGGVKKLKSTYRNNGEDSWGEKFSFILDCFLLSHDLTRFELYTLKSVPVISPLESDILLPPPSVDLGRKYFKNSLHNIIWTIRIRDYAIRPEE